MHLPFAIAPGSQVLVAGCGGGYDVVCALPVALELRRQGCSVHLSSYAFTELTEVGAESPRERLYRVDASCKPPSSGYFPEGWLAHWWKARFGEDKPVWSYRRLGVRPLAEVFAYLRSELRLDAIVVVDAGVDGLFLGNEVDLATPSTDAITLLAAYLQKDLPSFFGFCAFGTEGTAHEVRHVDALQRVAELMRTHSMLGVTALLAGTEVGEAFLDAVDFVHHRHQAHWRSNMASSLQSAMRGNLGYQNLTVKTDVAPIWVSPLTNLYWFFRLPAVAEAKPFLARALESDTIEQIQALFEEVRTRLGVLPWRDIPI